MQWYKFSERLPPYGEVVIARMKPNDYRAPFEAIVRIPPYPEKYKDDDGYESEDGYLMYSQETCRLDDVVFEDPKDLLAWISMPPIEGLKPFIEMKFEEGGNNVVGHYTTYDYELYDKEMSEGK